MLRQSSWKLNLWEGRFKMRKSKHLTLMIPRSSIVRVISQLLPILDDWPDVIPGPDVAFLLLDVLNVVAVVVVEADSNLWVSPNHRGGAVGHWGGFTGAGQDESRKDGAHLTRRREQWSTLCRRRLWSNLGRAASVSPQRDTLIHKLRNQLGVHNSLCWVYQRNSS